MKCHVCQFEGMFETVDVRMRGAGETFFILSSHGGNRNADSYFRMASRRDGLCACPECGTVRLDRAVRKDRE